MTRRLFGRHRGDGDHPVRRAPVRRRADGGVVGQVLDALRRVLRVIRLASVRVEREAGISGAQLFLLHQLADEPAGSVNELAARMHADQSSVSVLVRLQQPDSKTRRHRNVPRD